jgi:hypothetical protein
MDYQQTWKNLALHFISLFLYAETYKLYSKEGKRKDKLAGRVTEKYKLVRTDLSAVNSARSWDLINKKR